MADDEPRPSRMIEVRPGYFRASWPMAAAALILDGEDRVLLVQPSYYPGRWLMPGGGAELADSPRMACERELSEELGIEVAAGPLLAVDWIPAPSQGFAELIYVFDGGRLTRRQIESIRLPERELTDYQFLTLPDAVARLTAADGRRLAAACEAARAERGPVYLEHGVSHRAARSQAAGAGERVAEASRSDASRSRGAQVHHTDQRRDGG